MTSMPPAYAAWSAQNDLTGLAREAFDARFTALCRAVGFQPRRKNGRMIVADLSRSAQRSGQADPGHASGRV